MMMMTFGETFHKRRMKMMSDGTEKKLNPQTIASRKYHEKMGYKVRGFRLHKEEFEAFKEACAKAGVSQAGQIERMMREFCQANGVEVKEREKARQTKD